MDAVLAGAIGLLAAAIGFLLAREFSRMDFTGSRVGRQGEQMAGVSSDITALRDDIVRLQSADEALTVRLEANRATMATLNDTFMGQLSGVSSSIAKLEATMDALRQTVQGLIDAERERRQPPSQIDQLRQFAELLALMKKQV